MKDKFRKLQINTEFEIYNSEDELPQQDKELLFRAKESCLNAYAPYSNFNVGAAILLEKDVVVTGNNQENAAYPSGLCAERVALFYAKAQYKNHLVKTIAISCKCDSVEFEKPVSPCGACRQVIAEYELNQNQPIRIIMAAIKGEVYVCNGIEQLLPFMFNGKYLK